MLDSLSNSVKGLPGVRLATLLEVNSLIGFSEPAVRRCSTKYMFLNNSQNSQENTCVEVSF